MKTVLIADDYVDTVDLMAQFLSTLGFVTATAYDGPEAIDVARKLRPTSILLDIGLPMINGFEVARTLRQFRELDETTIIGCSGYTGLEYYDRAREAGMDFYLPKPVEPEVLTACLEPEKYPDVVVGNIADLSRELRERSFELQAKAQALSIKSSNALKQAQRFVEMAATVQNDGRSKASKAGAQNRNASR